MPGPRRRAVAAPAAFALCLAIRAQRSGAYAPEPGLAPFWERVEADPACDHLKDCGFPGITAASCRARGCCYDPHGPRNWCSGTASQCKTVADCSGHGVCTAGQCVCAAGWSGFNCSDVTITKVHLVQSCHLDIGFTDLSASALGFGPLTYETNTVVTIPLTRSVWGGRSRPG